MVKVKFFPEGKELKIKGAFTVKKLLKKLGILPNTALVVRNKQLLTSDKWVKDGDEIEIRLITSRG